VSVRGKRAIAWTVFVLGILFLIAQGWFEYQLRFQPDAADWTTQGWLQSTLFVTMILTFSTTGLILATRRPENALGWLLLAVGAILSISTGAYGRYSVLVEPLPFGRPALALDQWTWVPAIGLMGTYTILLFPDGHLPSRRWRWLGWLAFTTIVMASASILFADSPIKASPTVEIANPFAIHSLGAVFSALQFTIVLLPICLVASAVALVMRFRRSHGVERQQMKWLAFAGSVIAGLYLVVMILGVFVVTETPQPAWLGNLQVLALFSFALIPISIGFAVLRYRLWDIDVVISKTVVFGLLVGFITVVYVAVVVGIGTLLGDANNPALSIAATALVALLFGPVRERVRRFANRLVYGKRATPYEVMAGFAHRVSGSISVDQVLPEMAEVAARGVGARAARVRVTLPRAAERARTWPEDTDGPFDRSLDVAYQGDVIGAIEVAMPAGEPLRPDAERLLDDLAAQAGLALHNVRLTEELAIRAGELAAQAEGLRISRERLVTARDAQRRGLERDIREGPERQLQEIRSDLQTVTVEEPRAEERLDALTARANETLEGLRDLARGIFPPLLADQGVVAALEAHIRKVGANAKVHATPEFTADRFDADVEACLYFCSLQAIQNVLRHAGNAVCTVELDADGSVIRFALSDRGAGFDPATTPRGMGIDIMQDRIDALEGELVVTSAPGAGTTIEGTVPLSRRRVAAS
jgi:signal transduction histidine kinase